MSLLSLPVELRCNIYDAFLAIHTHVWYREQPSNTHLRLLLVSKQIHAEATHILSRYISLLHERQIVAFVKSSADFTRVTHADVANDGRLVQLHTCASQEGELHPLSQLHVALSLLSSLQHLRVFECRQGVPFHGSTASRLTLQSELAMFPAQSCPTLLTYELMLFPGTRARPFSILPSTSLRTLRLSGDCLLPASTPLPHLTHLSLHGVDGNFFDRHAFTECFPAMSRLETFSYALLTKTGFELRNVHLESLVQASGSSLRKLVLIDCNRLTSTTIAHCLASMPNLEYFALSLITVEELHTNFLTSLPSPIRVLKLKVVNAWYAVALQREEKMLCDTIEVLLRTTPFSYVALNLRASVIEGQRADTLKQIAQTQGISLSIGPWETDEHI